MNKLPKRRTQAAGGGFSLIELLIGLMLFFIVAMGGLDFFSRCRRLFFHLTSDQDAAERAAAALERARLDILEAGQGLAEPIRQDLIQGIEAAISRVTLTSAEEENSIPGGLAAGATAIPLSKTSGFSAGREVCLIDDAGGELREIQAVRDEGLILTAPLLREYRAGRTAVLLLRQVMIAWDPGTKTLRRKINSSSPQPLLEEVASFTAAFDPERLLLSIGLRMTAKPEDFYEITVFPKNLALACKAGTT